MTKYVRIKAEIFNELVYEQYAKVISETETRAVLEAYISSPERTTQKEIIELSLDCLEEISKEEFDSCYIKLSDTAEFKPGDVVRLKSGGPKMTVEFVRGNEVNCIWFGSEKDVHRITVALEALCYEI